MEEKRFGLSKTTIDKINTAIRRVAGVEKILLYGSRAKGNYKMGSDIDLVLIAPQLTTSDLLKIQNEVDELSLPYKLDISLFHQIDNPDLLDHIRRVGVDFIT